MARSSRSTALERMPYCRKISACRMKSSSTVGSPASTVGAASAVSSLLTEVMRLAMALKRLLSSLPRSISRRFLCPASYGSTSAARSTQSPALMKFPAA